MDKDTIISMARAQGLPETETEGVFRVNADDLGRMLAVEREACAKVAWKTPEPEDEYVSLREAIVNAIRSRNTC